MLPIAGPSDRNPSGHLEHQPDHAIDDRDKPPRGLGWGYPRNRATRSLWSGEASWSPV